MKKLIRLAAATAAVVMGLTMFTAGSASAAQAGSCNLLNGPSRNHFVDLFLTCPPKSPGDVIWKINLWGDDTISDNRIHTYYVDCDLPSTVTMNIHENRLNEDIADRDEIYAGVWFRRPDGSTYGIQSITIAGWWGVSNVIIPSPAPLC
ncbi:hypothetical protein Aph01nite_11910 [Acrocarpospora phusangensis]|uniref:Spore-associated protein A n=1 Tax=Acrocarpospora phusangensis TaxID=1070424 RepID=A0A919Q7A9_9ACTN|nr:hypothetical protein [Acrocarpospora phusangensis]GIH22881.1 hypothetical protein Aph01nite_11910 [Acrocarpospora phusangensis]